jgi:hypothetical protein
MLTILCTVLLTYVFLSYVAGIVLFIYDLPRNPTSLLPFGILLLVLSPISAPHGIYFYYKEFKNAKEKAEANQE